MDRNLEPELQLGLCVTDPDAWDIEHGNLTDWMRAVRACMSCPLLDDCRDRFDEVRPQGMIMGGSAFSPSGTPLDTTGLRALWRSQQRVLQVQASAASTADSAVA